MLICLSPLLLAGCWGDLAQNLNNNQAPINLEEKSDGIVSDTPEIELGSDASSSISELIPLATSTKKVGKFYPSVASNIKPVETADPNKDFAVTPELLAKMYLADKYKPGTCYGLPKPVPEEAVAGMIARNPQLAQFLKQKYELSSDLDIYNKIKQLNGISLDKLGSGNFNFEFMDAQCCTMTGYQGQVLIIGSNITDKVDKQETKTNPC